MSENALIRARNIALIPVIIFPVLIATFLVFGIYEPIFEPPYLILILNTIFLTLSSLTVAIISARSYLGGANANILLLSSAFLINGVAAAIAGWFFSFSIDYTVAIYNTCTLFSATLQLVNASFSPKTLGLETNKARLKTKLFAVYSLSILLTIIVTTLAYFNLFPRFFSEGTGPTALDIGILGFSILSFAASSLLLIHRNLRLKSEVLFWYSLGLALFAIGLFGVSQETSLGDPIGWAGKIAQYIGGLYFIAAVASSRKSQHGTSISEKWSESFGSDRLQLENLFSKIKRLLLSKDYS